MRQAEKREQQEILEDKDVSRALQFARDVEGADIKALQAMVIERGDGTDAYSFARHIEGADVEALQAVVIGRGRAHDAYLFAKYVEGADIESLQAVVLERGAGGNTYYRFARDIEGADPKPLLKKALSNPGLLDEGDVADARERLESITIAEHEELMLLHEPDLDGREAPGAVAP